MNKILNLIPGWWKKRQIAKLEKREAELNHAVKTFSMPGVLDFDDSVKKGDVEKELAHIQGELAKLKGDDKTDAQP